MYKFKKADRVRNLESNGFVKQGAVGTVIEDGVEYPTIEWDDEGMVGEEFRYCMVKNGGAGISRYKDYLELITEESTPPKESAPLYGGKTEEEWLWIFAGQAMQGCISAYAGAANWPTTEDLNKRVMMYSQALIDELKKQTEQQ